MSLGSPDNTKYKSKREKKRLMTINDALETVVNNAVVKHHVSMCSIFLTVSTLGHVMNSIYFFCYLDDEQLK